MTNRQRYYELVRHFRESARLKDQPFELHWNMFQSEQKEFYDAENDHKAIDGICDSMFVWLGCKIDRGQDIYLNEDWLFSWASHSASVIGADLWNAFNLVYKSNMSKLCTDAEIQPTIDKYESLGVSVIMRETESGLWACYSDSDHPDYPCGKLLKSVGFKEPDWSQEGWRV